MKILTIAEIRAANASMLHHMVKGQAAAVEAEVAAVQTGIILDRRPLSHSRLVKCRTVFRAGNRSRRRAATITGHHRIVTIELTMSDLDLIWMPHHDRAACSWVAEVVDDHKIVMVGRYRDTTVGNIETLNFYR